MSKLKKIYHIADVHIRNVKRHNEYRQVFEKMFDEIRKRGTDNSIIYLAGDIAHAKLELSPELVREISWLFTECSKLCETILITGNHDCNMNNSDRLDVLTPIVEALNLPNFIYLRDTQVYSIGGVDFGVFSIFDDKANWPKAETLFGNKKIALFHGPVDNSQTDIGYVVSSRHFTPDMFDGYDLALLGDIHKRQTMISPAGCKVVYAGSLIQQNFGETLDKHGFLVWDLDSMKYEEVDIQNDYGYYTMDVDNGKVPIVTDMPKKPRLRVRLSNTDSADTKRVMAEIKMKYGVEDFTIIRTDSLAKSKTGNRLNKLDFEDISDINYQNSLINEYVERMMPFVDKEDLDRLENINRDINSRIVNEDVQRNIQWKPIRFEFDNMFSYGEKNKIDFTKLGGLMGLFAPNATGKSSLFDAISFCLYDKSSRAYKAQNIMNNRKSEFACHLHFQIDGLDYHIERTAKTINKGKNVKVDVQFWRQDGDDRTSLNGTERRDTNTIIEQYVGTYEDFVLTALSLQGNNALFIDKSQSERKDLLAQFMGLNIFDKLYETATEDIKEVSVLIKNFKKTDFTTELADKANDLKDKKVELKNLEKELGRLNTDSTDLADRIVGLSRELTPIDGNLNLQLLTKQEGELGRDILHILSEKKLKGVKIEEYVNLIAEVSQSIEENKTINDLPIEEAKREWDLLKDQINDTIHQIELLENGIEHNKEKLSHLAEHEYDPNCNFCMNNVFVKDAIETQKKVDEQGSQLETLNILHGALVTQAGKIANVEEQWETLTDLKAKYQKAIVIKEKAEAESLGFDTKVQLLEHQLQSVKDNIQKYHDNEETIKRNVQIDGIISGLQQTKSEIESDIKKVTKDIATLNGSISSIS